MVDYQYPEQVTDENFQELVKRAIKIKRRTNDLDIILILLLAAIFVAILYPPLWYFRGYFQSLTDPRLLIITVFLISIGISIFASTFLAEWIKLFLRRLNFAIAHFPTSEESIFAECFIILNLLDKNRVCGESWHSRYQSAIWRTHLLCDEFSLYTKDLFNVKRRCYAPEFRLLAGGTNQINRMFLFSGSIAESLLGCFALAFVKNNDVIAYRYLKKIVNESAKYGNLENWLLRLENQLKKPMGIVSLIGGTITVIGGLLALIASILGLL